MKIYIYIVILLLVFLSTSEINAQSSDVERSKNIKIPISLMSKPFPGDINPFKSKINYPILAG